MSVMHRPRIFFALIFITLLAFPFLSIQADVAATATQSQLQQQLAQIQQQIAQYQQQLNGAKGQANSLANKIKQLQAQQAALNLQIKATNLRIGDLDSRLADTQVAISLKESTLGTLHGQMAEVLRQVDRHDREPLWYALLTSQGANDLTDDVTSYLKIGESLKAVSDETHLIKDQLVEQREELASQRVDANNLLSIKSLQQHDLVDAVGEQSTLLKETKGRESSYQQAISDRKKQVATIQSRLYQLLEVSKQISFGQAVQIATYASQQTGVQPAFLLAILSQESSLGANVGTCNRKGDPPSKSWKVVMKPERDQAPFKTITSELGMDIDTTPISCPMRDKAGNQIGWGGAMGAAQFIPSTWMGYRNQVAAITGKGAASPWDIRDAFVAAALLLKRGGADGTRQGYWNAAMRYFSGSTNPAYRFYGDSVLTRMDSYQSDIDKLNGK